MRVIAGLVKGHKIAAPKGDFARPTTDRVRENIFNILQDFPSGARVLDLFAGSGALGLEALSRGAGAATFVDSSAIAIETIKKNLAATGFELSAKLYKCRAADYFTRHQDMEKKFNLIFLDPPYKISAVELRRIFINLPNYLAGGGLTILELGRKLSVSLSITLELVDSRRYGDTFIYFFKRR